MHGHWCRQCASGRSSAGLRGAHSPSRRRAGSVQGRAASVARECDHVMPTQTSLSGFSDAPHVRGTVWLGAGGTGTRARRAHGPPRLPGTVGKPVLQDAVRYPLGQGVDDRLLALAGQAAEDLSRRNVA